MFKMADSISTKIRAKRTQQEETPEQRQERLKKNAGSQIDGVENQKLLKNVVLGLTVKRPIIGTGPLWAQTYPNLS